MRIDTTYRRGVFVMLGLPLALAFVVSSAVPQVPEAYAALGPNLVPNPGLETAGSSDNPANWARGRWGTNTAAFTYPVAGYSSPRAVRAAITSYTSGDAKWYFSDVPVSGNTMYQFSDYFRSSVPSYVTLRLQNASGGYRYVDIGYGIAPSSDWQNFTASFTTPSDMVSLTVFHLIKSAGWLDTDNYSLSQISSDPTRFPQGIVSLNFDDGNLSVYQNAIPILNRAGYKSTQFIVTGRMFDGFPGYVKVNQILTMQSQGHEIGAHTRTHPDLTTLSADDLQSEVAGSRQDLFDLGVLPVNFFAYPFGSYNDTVVQAAKDAGFLAARTADGGYNLKNQDPFLLNRRGVRVYTTIDQIKGYIDTALRDRTWLILVFHDVSYSGDEYSATPDTLQQTVDYLRLKNAKVVTMGQGFQLMHQ